MMKIFILAAMTADGLIAHNNQELANWTSAADKRFFVKMTKEAGVMVFGSRTYDTIGKPLPGRKTVVYTNHPQKYTNQDVMTTSAPPRELIQTLADEGFNSVAICGGQQVYEHFMHAGVITDLYITMEPIVFGNGVSLFKSRMNRKLKLVATETFDGGAVLLHYRSL